MAGGLFGGGAYDDLLSPWDREGGQFKDGVDQAPKNVVSTTLREPLPWPNSTLLRGDIPEAVRTLKAQTSGVLGVMGSGELIKSLLPADVIDEYLLMIHPLILGTGRRLFSEQVKLALRLTACVTSSAGVVITTYVPEKNWDG